jgi:hypothetical protein
VSTTAEQFCDAMNARRIITQQAHSDEHAENLLRLLKLRIPDIEQRYAVGAKIERTVECVIVAFVDDSAAVVTATGRWTPAVWAEAA